MPDEPLETVNVRNNPESRSAASDTSSTVSRANDGGAPPREAPGSGDLPEAVEHGTAAGSPVSGVTISDQDAADAVRTDDAGTS
ncbi:MAG: hypothetical protein AVDCRST_MAG61-1056 [uncultured Friedmanniella sp.]|uniref:Uncharacterized protein n=1 Tax=uncultured Friedmanniella sp. TaxID=335381 RepID=A0A6J4KBY1_9ACTN|nr:hypothetical protein [uncultured Friedmanniella sp.]CAA9301730.1 MAG: hypothetical protein AVDCRST_MAG61-1056 [uncultured Friedmanniella sp.]